MCDAESGQYEDGHHDVDAERDSWRSSRSVRNVNGGNIANKPAIQMNVGRLSGATLLDGGWYGGVDVVGKDSTASWVSRSSGGLILSADQHMVTMGRRSAGLNGHSQHTIVGGYSGEATARWSLDADGVAQYGDGKDAKQFDTRLDRPRVVEAAWDPRPMAVGHQGGGRSGDAFNVSVPSAAVGDLLQVPLSPRASVHSASLHEVSFYPSQRLFNF